MCVIKFNHSTEFQSKANVRVLAALLKVNFTVVATFLLVDIISHYVKEFKMQCCVNNSSNTFGRHVYRANTF